MKFTLEASQALRSKKGEYAMLTLSRRNAICFTLLAAAMPLVTSVAKAAADVPLAIQGYDPVAYFTDGKPTHGTAGLRISMG